jgi:hypothetical protein
LSASGAADGALRLGELRATLRKASRSDAAAPGD